MAAIVSQAGWVIFFSRRSGGAVKVPYAKKWQKETDTLRKIVLDCGLSEELKWGKPCFTYQDKNVAIVIPLKDTCAFSFFKGALLKDPKGILKTIGAAQAGRWIKFTSVDEITAVQPILKSYVREAIKIEKSGKKVALKKASDYAVPTELQARLDAAPKLRAAFEGLTPGRRKSYIFHVSGAKQEKTRTARAEQCVPMILSGRGFNERP
ncbi:MAG TPA: YdeI/OmpD-associated family protein [Steroidobacteraceae bacterium]|nr:YdeI/OmpD-associated family protein [Steroidobacteraceae bacterium]